MKGAEIPVSEAKALAEKYGYEQVVILTLRPHEDLPNWFMGWATTYNTDKKRCGFLGKIAAILHNSLRALYADEATTLRYHAQLG
ncbi:MAG: hypothetical protein AB7D57_06665, partial [Desulfovibrionaceae bacterium]